MRLGADGELLALVPIRANEAERNKASSLLQLIGIASSKATNLPTYSR